MRNRGSCNLNSCRPALPSLAYTPGKAGKVQRQKMGSMWRRCWWKESVWRL